MYSELAEAKEAESGQIRKNVAQLSEGLDQLEKALASLRERLHPVISPGPIPGVTSISIKEPAYSPLASELQALADRLRGLTESVFEYKNELDL